MKICDIASGPQFPEGPVALADGKHRPTTNRCFGGPDRRTVFVTLSGSGHLIAIDDRPVPRLRANGEA